MSSTEYIETDICLYCAQPIYKDKSGWAHSGGFQVCPNVKPTHMPTYATPSDTAHSKKEIQNGTD